MTLAEAKSLVEKEGFKVEEPGVILKEMAMIGELNGPKIGKYLIEVFSNEYEHETPHITLELPRKPRRLPIAKVEIPSNQPALTDIPNVLWVEKDFNLSNKVLDALASWYCETDEDGLTGWQNARRFWKNQAKSFSWGQIALPKIKV
jgi:hypothetical protein